MDISEEAKKELAEPIERIVEAQELVPDLDRTKLSHEELKASKLNLKLSRREIITESKPSNITFSALNLRLTRIEEKLYDHDQRTTSAIRELQSHSEELVPALRLLRKQVILWEAKYLASGAETLDSSSKEELAHLMQNWGLYMNDESTRLYVEAEAIEFAYKKLCTFASEKNSMIEHLRHAVCDMRFLHDRLFTSKVVESTATQTDEPESSFDVSQHDLWPILYSLQRMR